MEADWEETGGSYNFWDSSRGSVIQLPAFDKVVFVVCRPRRKRRPREVKSLSVGHPALGWQS